MNRTVRVPSAVSFLREWMEYPAVSFAAGVAVLALTSLYCVLPLLTHNAVPLGHDTLFHIFQAEQFRQGLGSGSVYPRWAADANNGYGIPNFIFYAPLAYYLLALVNLWEPSMIMSMVYVIWSGFFLSGLSMFYAARRMYGIPGSLLAAVAYQVLPFHLIDLYHRGTFAALFAYSWLPLFFCCLQESNRPERTRMTMAGLSVSYAGVILTHLGVGFMVSIVAGACLLYRLIFLKGRKTLAGTLAALLIGLGISSAYLVPAAWERKYVHIDVLLKYEWARNFLLDFRFAHLFEIFYRLLNVTFCLEIGLFSLTVLLYRTMAGTREREESAGFLILVFVLASLLVTPVSKPVWELISPFQMLAFPWRWIIVTELFLCFLIALTFSRDGVRHARRANLVKCFLLVVLFCLSLLPMQTIHGATITEGDLARLKARDQWKNVMDENFSYLPIWVTDMRNILTWSRRDRVVAISGQAAVRVTEWSPENRTIEVRATSDAVIRISTFYYPGWSVTRDGNGADIAVERGTGAILVNVPRGVHTIRASFVDTILRRISKYTSLISLVLWIPVAMLFGGSGRSKGVLPP